MTAAVTKRTIVTHFVDDVDRLSCDHSNTIYVTSSNTRHRINITSSQVVVELPVMGMTSHCECTDIEAWKGVYLFGTMKKYVFIYQQEYRGILMSTVNDWPFITLHILHVWIHQSSLRE